MAASDRTFQQVLDRLAAAPSALAASDQFRELVFGLLGGAAKNDGRAPIEGGIQPARAGLPGYLPEGIGDLRGPTGVLVAFLRSNTDADREHLRTRVLGAASNAARANVGRLLVIHNQVFSSPIDVGDSPSGVELVFWDARELEEVASAEPSTWARLASQVLLRSVRRSVDAVDEWRAESDEVLADLRATYASDGVTLILGAGVSQGSGLPGWDALIGGLFTMAFADRLPTLLDADQSLALAQAAADLNSHSPLQTARYLRSALEDTESQFEDQLASVLYARSRNKDNPLLDAVASLCVPGRDRPHVHSVITYNFDDLLEDALGRIPVEFTSIFHDHEVPTTEALGVYHVHGFLPRDRRGIQHLDESLIAFSEEVYHQLYVDPYHWTNIFQLNELRSRTCVLIGLSLTDPNLRRLLDIAARGFGSPRHFALMRRVHDTQLLEQHGHLSEIPVEARQQFLDIHHAIQETVLASLRVRTIWFDSHDAISPALRSIRQV